MNNHHKIMIYCGDNIYNGSIYDKVLIKIIHRNSETQKSADTIYMEYANDIDLYEIVLYINNMPNIRDVIIDYYSDKSALLITEIKTNVVLENEQHYNNHNVQYINTLYAKPLRVKRNFSSSWGNTSLCHVIGYPPLSTSLLHILGNFHQPFKNNIKVLILASGGCYYNLIPNNYPYLYFLKIPSLCGFENFINNDQNILFVHNSNTGYLRKMNHNIDRIKQKIIFIFWVLRKRGLPRGVRYTILCIIYPYIAFENNKFKIRMPVMFNKNEKKYIFRF